MTQGNIFSQFYSDLRQSLNKPVPSVHTGILPNTKTQIWLQTYDFTGTSPSNSAIRLSPVNHFLYAVAIGSYTYKDFENSRAFQIELLADTVTQLQTHTQSDQATHFSYKGAEVSTLFGWKSCTIFPIEFELMKKPKQYADLSFKLKYSAPRHWNKSNGENIVIGCFTDIINFKGDKGAQNEILSSYHDRQIFKAEKVLRSLPRRIF